MEDITIVHGVVNIHNIQLSSGIAYSFVELTGKFAGVGQTWFQISYSGFLLVVVFPH